uniref:MARVEL domain-containing protein n=1 Tax=Meloidogyne hapla TaxID=6305 RepID=A0A1I8B6G6_MELHA
MATAAPIQFVAGSALKIVIILLTVVVLVLLDPSYVTAYISIIMYAIMQRSVRDGEELHLTNCSLSEIVFAGAGMICWMLVCGIGGTVAQRTIIDACAGIIVCLFAGVVSQN